MLDKLKEIHGEDAEIALYEPENMLVFDYVVIDAVGRTYHYHVPDMAVFHGQSRMEKIIDDLIMYRQPNPGGSEPSG